MNGTVKILVIRVGRVGDMLMITPAFRALLDAYPDAEFHLLTSKDGEKVFNGFSDRLTACLVHDRKDLLEKIKLWRLLRQVKNAAYNHAFCFECNPTFKPFYRAAKDGGHCIDHRPNELYARRCLDVVANAVGRPMDNYWLHLPISEKARGDARALLAENGIGDDAFVVGFHPTYSGLTKSLLRRRTDKGRQWPSKAYAELARRMLSHADRHHINMRIIMDLMPREADIGDEIVRLSGGHITMLTPPPDFQRYKATLERMDLLVTTDTGPMHAGGAVGTRLVALFGATRPEDSGAYVPGNRCRIVKSPSRQISDISPGEVFDACRYFLPHPGEVFSSTAP